MKVQDEVFIQEEGSLPAGGLLVRLGEGRRPFTLTRNALGALRRALTDWEGRPGLRWVAFTAASSTTFLAGADFREIDGMTPWRALSFARLGQNLYAAMRSSPLWLISCVEGACMGGGLDFALACDYRIASKEASLGHPGPKLGFFTGWGGTAALPARGGRGRGALLSAAVLGAEAALEAGWIEEIATNPITRAAERARRSAALDLSALKAMQRWASRPFGAALRLEHLVTVTHGMRRDTL